MSGITHFLVKHINVFTQKVVEAHTSLKHRVTHSNCLTHNRSFVCVFSSLLCSIVDYGKNKQTLHLEDPEIR